MFSKKLLKLNLRDSLNSNNEEPFRSSNSITTDNPKISFDFLLRILDMLLQYRLLQVNHQLLQIY